MKGEIKTLLVGLLTFIGQSVFFPASATEFQNYQNDLRKGFVPNNGQFSYSDGSYAEEVLAKTSIANADVYITKKGLVYIFREMEEEEDERDSKKADSYHEEKWRAMEVDMLSANISAANLIYDSPLEGMYFNYYSGRNPNGVKNVKRFEQITVKEIYPGIDWILYANKDGFKYDFVVHPGANTDDIKLSYKGAGSVSLAESGKSLKISTELGALMEGDLKCFLKENKSSLTSRYKLKNNVVSFVIEGYDKSKTLVIDPPVYLIWSTIINPSTGLVGPMDIFSDHVGNSYITGYGGMGMGFPLVNPGGSTYYSGAAGVLGGFIMKLNTAGTIMWCTYFENGDMYGAVDLNNNVYVTGRVFTTIISQPLPIVNRVGAYNIGTALGGITDAFVAMFDGAGALNWCTYLGGTDSDYGIGIRTDAAGSVFITGETQSTDFPVANSGTYFDGVLAGASDAFITKFDGAGAMIWSTYFGDAGDETGRAVCVSSTGDVNFTGYTTSILFPTHNPGSVYFQSALGGTSDAYVAKFDNAGNRIWSTLFGGNGDEVGMEIEVDALNNLYLSGGTSSANNFPLQNPMTGAYFQSTFGGTSDLFVTKFSPSGAMNWSTYYGGNANDVGGGVGSTATRSAMVVDGPGNIYIAGTTASTNLPLSNPGGGAFYSPSLMGSTDVFVTRFNATQALSWSTYFGGTLMDFSRGITMDTAGCVIFTGETQGITNYPLLNPGGGAYYDSTHSGGEKGIIVKFCHVNCSQPSIAASAGGTICAGASTLLTALGATWYTWSSPAGTGLAVGSSVTVSPTDTTTYMLIGSVIGGCEDTTYVTINVDSAPVISSSAPSSICYGASTVISASGGVSYSWSPGSGLSSTTGSSITANPTSNTTYTVVVSSSNGCTSTGFATVTVNIPSPITVSGSTSICIGASTTLTASGALTYGWFPSAGLSSTTGAIVTATPPSNGTYTVVGVDINGCASITTANMVLNAIPNANAGSNQTICRGQGTIINASGGTAYSWSSGSAIPTATVSPLTNTVYTVTVSNGNCRRTAVVTVSVNIPPTVNAGNNDTINPGLTTTLSATGGGSYVWSPSQSLSCSTCANPIASPTVTTMYYLAVTDANGCTSLDSVIIYVEVKCEEGLIIPNVITPNADGRNDLFKITGFDPCILDKYTIKIYNRWGLVVFESNNATITFWNGRSPSGNVVDGTYYYALSSPHADLKGFITVLSN